MSSSMPLRKYCISGTYCSGKTTLCDILARNSLNTSYIREVARDLTNAIPNIDWSHPFVRGYLTVEQILRENACEGKRSHVFLDAGVESNIAHTRLFGGHFPIADLAKLGHTNYAHVFVCSPFDVTFQADGTRLTDPVLRIRIHEEILLVIKELGLDWTFLEGDIQARAARVLRIVSDIESKAR